MIMPANLRVQLTGETLEELTEKLQIPVFNPMFQITSPVESVVDINLRARIWIEISNGSSNAAV